MTLLEAVLGVNSKGLSFRPKGFINVEGGLVAASTQYRGWCDCTAIEFGAAKSNCSECGRSATNFANVPSGDGDGVYVVSEIYSNASPAETFGALVVFDHGYAIANAVRVSIENDTLPDLGIKELMPFAETLPLHLTTFESSKTILIGDSPIVVESRNATADVSFLDSKTTEVFAFVGHLSPEPEDVALRLQANLGMDPEEANRSVLVAEAAFRALEEIAGSQTAPFSPDLEFRALLVIDSRLAMEIDLQGEVAVSDWALLSHQCLSGIGTSHVEPLHQSTVFMNALLARELDRAAGEEVSDQDAKRLLFDVWTWAYQGLVHDDKDCEVFRKNRYVPSREEVAELLRRRGQFEAADSYLRTGSLNGQALDSNAQSNNHFGLTNASNKGLGSTAPAQQAGWCSACGEKYQDDAAKFCSSCGKAR
jgi:hypothetical protein